MNNKKYHIEHLGKTLHTDHWVDLDSEICQKIRNEYYSKPEFALVKNNLLSIHRGGSNVSSITNYYFKDLMAKVKLYSPKWSIEEALQSDDLIRYFYSRILSSEKVYPSTNSLIKNFECALRLSGGGVAMKPSNFPMKVADEVIKKFNINNRYYDFSCGWGVRMLSSLKNNVEYYGTDPNHILVERLLQLHSDYNDANKTSSTVNIRCHGSEKFVPEWANSFGFAFSSPPYFILEDYKIGDQSTNNRSYDQWLIEYMLATLRNVKEYLIKEGHLLLNIKNFSNYDLYDDTLMLAKDVGFKFEGTMTLNNITRPSAKSDINTDENIMILKND